MYNVPPCLESSDNQTDQMTHLTWCPTSTLKDIKVIFSCWKAVIGWRHLAEYTDPTRYLTQHRIAAGHKCTTALLTDTSWRYISSYGAM